MITTEIRVSGYGGQGVILSAYVIGQAASIYEDKYATLTQAFGPEARGSACSAQLVISDKRILYPLITSPDILMCMSQEAYTKFEPGMKEDGILLIDEDLVSPKPPRGSIRIYAIPATRFAEELGRRMVLNIVMTGFFTAITGLIDAKAMRESILKSIPKGTETLNISAFDKGYEHGLKLIGKEPVGSAKTGS